MTTTILTDDQLIGELIHSYGHLWECEPPMYSCFCEVKSKEVTTEKILATIEHTIINLDDLEDLLTEQDLTGSIWTFILEMRWDEDSTAWQWHYNDTNPDDRQVLLSEIEDKASCLETIFSEFDWYGYLDHEWMKTSDLMAKIPENTAIFMSRTTSSSWLMESLYEVDCDGGSRMHYNKRLIRDPVSSFKMDQLSSQTLATFRDGRMNDGVRTTHYNLTTIRHCLNIKMNEWHHPTSSMLISGHN